MEFISPRAASDAEDLTRETDRRQVGFKVTPPKQAAPSVLADTMNRYAEARAKMKEARARTKAQQSDKPTATDKPRRADGMSFSRPERFRSLDEVKGLPSLPGGFRTARNFSRSASHHHSGARSLNESFSAATTSLTVRSSAQISEDRAFKSGFLGPEALLNESAEERNKYLSLEPLMLGRGEHLVGTAHDSVWKGELREIQPSSSKGDPIANNSMSRTGLQHPQFAGGTGLFAMEPELLGQWREDFDMSGLDEKATNASRAAKGAWIPASWIKQRDQALAYQEKKRAQEAARKEQELRELQEREKRKKAREAEEAAERAEQDRLAALRAEAEAKIAEEKKRREEQKRKLAKQKLALLSGGKRGARITTDDE